MGISGRAVFLSHASQDAQAARRICEALQAVGIEVWFDQGALQGGDAWDACIRTQIKDCALFVAIISANTNARSEGYFRLEWKLAVDRSHLMADDQAFLLPVVIDDTLDASARVPDKFRDVQWTRLTTSKSPVAFAEHVRRLLSGGGASVPAMATRATAFSHASTVAPHACPSIAVLPFVNRSRDEEDEYFSDGLADELLNVLTKIGGLRVAARSSSFQFKGRNEDIATVGRKLNVATILEGSVRKSGKRMRISVQLVNVADGYHLWSERYDRTLEDIFAVQDDIAQSVVNELRATLLGAGASRTREAAAQVAAAVKGRTADSEAHRLFLQARYLVDRNTREDTKKAIAYFGHALDRDPAFALAWAELSRAYSNEAGFGWVPMVEGFERARDAVTRSLALDPQLAEGHAQLGWIQMAHDWHWHRAQASYARALELAPGNTDVLRLIATLTLNLGGLAEAIGLYRRVIEQDPLSTYMNLGLALHAAGCLAEAEQALRKALELAPQRSAAHMFLALNLLAQGRGDEALAEALREPEEWARLFAFAIIRHAEGARAEADAALHELIVKYGERAGCQVAEVYASRGESDAAFEWLEKAYILRDGGLSELNARPLLRPLHADPRWSAFMRRMGLAD